MPRENPVSNFPPAITIVVVIAGSLHVFGNVLCRVIVYDLIYI